MSSASSKGFENIADTQMVEVPKDFFFEGMPLLASIYLKINPGSYLLIGKKGDKAAFNNLHAYNRANACLYVKNAEYVFLIQQVTNVTSRVLGQKSVPDGIKIKFLTGLTEDATRALEASGFTSAGKVQKVSQMLVQMGQNLNAFNEVLDVLENLPNHQTKHSMTTCLISMLLCEEMNVTLPLALEKAAMGALLHDIGLNLVPTTILEKPRHLWTQEEMQVYELHPIKAVEMLRDSKDIPSDVLLIIVEHHENSQGTGFPKKLRDVKISPLAKIVGLADYFSDLLFNERTGVKHYGPDEAIQYIEDILGQPYNKQVFLALKNIINKKHLADKS